MKCDEIRNHILDHDCVEECPLCRDHLSQCPECAEFSRIHLENLEMGRVFEEITSYPGASAFEERLISTCISKHRFIRTNGKNKKRTGFAWASAVAILVVISTLLVYFFPSKPAKPEFQDFISVNKDFASLLSSVESSYGVDIHVFPKAKQTAWSRNASLFVPNADAITVAKALARAFDLEATLLDDELYIMDRATAYVCSTENSTQGRKEVKLDLQFALEPDEFDKMDRIANNMISVDDLKFNAPVSKSAQIPFLKNDSDVTVLKRPDETFEVRRSLPWVMVDQSSGKLEFVAITDDDLARFNALRGLIRALEDSSEKLENKISIPAELTENPIELPAQGSIADILAEISRQSKLKVVVGSGADIMLPAPKELPTTSVLAALDGLCKNRMFYFTLLDDGKTILIDERANLQRYLRILVVKAPEGTASADLDHRLQTVHPTFFDSEDTRTGVITSTFRDYVIIRHHIYPLWVMSQETR